MQPSVRPPLLPGDQQVVELSFQLDDFGLGGLSTTLGLSSGGRFLITSLAIPAGGLLDLLQLILQLCNLGVLFLSDRMGSGMGGLVVLHGLGQVCGGVDVREVDAQTMESKKVKGLYFAGEILDVDGICGGYNLQWAWSSGAAAGKCAGRASDK